MPTNGNPFSIYDVIGLCGVLAYIGAYFGIQILRMKPSSTVYGALNVAGPVLILVSLSQAFNLASFVTQAFWLVLTLAGMLRKQERSKKGDRRIPSEDWPDECAGCAVRTLRS